MKQKIDCDIFESTVNDLLDRRISLESNSGLAEHIRECDDCAELYGGYLKLESLYSTTESQELGEGEKLGLFDSGKYPVPENFGKDQLVLKDPRPFDKRELEHGRYGVLALVCSVAAAIAILIGVGTMDWGEPKLTAGLDKKLVEENPSVLEVKSKEGVKGEAADQGQVVVQDKSRVQSLVNLSESPVIELSNELPYVRPLKSSINVAIDFFQSFSESKSRKADPDLGFRILGSQNQV